MRPEMTAAMSGTAKAMCPTETRPRAAPAVASMPQLFIVEKAPLIWIAAGPRRMMKSAGKIQNTRGKTILTGAAKAFSWAR